MSSDEALLPPHFPSTYTEILQRIDDVDPIAYGSTRNYINGYVSYLSPYISRGVISTKFVLLKMLEKGHTISTIEKFIQELAWRDYWQQVWVAKGNAIDKDLRHPQSEVDTYEIPEAIVKGGTGISAIDRAVAQFYYTGYLHNHVRMYIAALSCNIGRCHWRTPAKWMYYHLLDADWASNALSWQWVAGSNSNKKYVANQENINKYCLTSQKGTFLDIPYSALVNLDVPQVLSSTIVPNLNTPLPLQGEIILDAKRPTLIYNFYNLDPKWKADLDANRVLLIAPSHFYKYPISQNSMDFMLTLGKNIENIQVFVGEFKDLILEYKIKDVYFKEHPTNSEYHGNRESRDWMFSVSGYYPSFFSFWKKCRKELNY